MIVQNQSAASLSWYDRGYTIIERRYHGTALGYHVNTVRASYTVPTNKRAIIMSAYVEQRIEATASTSLQLQVYSLNYKPDGGSDTILLSSMRPRNITGEKGIAILYSPLYLNPLDEVSLVTYNFTSTGTITYGGSFLINELTP